MKQSTIAQDYMHAIPGAFTTANIHCRIFWLLQSLRRQNLVYVSDDTAAAFFRVGIPRRL
jgi:hypothetical protein